jgi:hypothetical protein
MYFLLDCAASEQELGLILKWTMVFSFFIDFSLNLILVFFGEVFQTLHGRGNRRNIS